MLLLSAIWVALTVHLRRVSDTGGLGATMAPIGMPPDLAAPTRACTPYSVPIWRSLQSTWLCPAMLTRLPLRGRHARVNFAHLDLGYSDNTRSGLRLGAITVLHECQEKPV